MYLHLRNREPHGGRHQDLYVTRRGCRVVPPKEDPLVRGQQKSRANWVLLGPFCHPSQGPRGVPQAADLAGVAVAHGSDSSWGSLSSVLWEPQHQIPSFSHLNQACSGVLRYPTQKSQKTHWGVPVCQSRHSKDPRSMPGTEARHGRYVNLRAQGDTHTYVSKCMKRSRSGCTHACVYIHM